MTLYRHCDGPECDGSQLLVTDLADTWFHVIDQRDEETTHFCDPDCLLKWVASWSKPKQDIDNRTMDEGDG